MRGVSQQVLAALMDLMYRGEDEIEKKPINSFVKQCIETEMFGFTKDTLERERSDLDVNQRKAFKHWDREFCQKSDSEYDHTRED